MTSDTVKLTVTRLDIDADSNNDASISHSSLEDAVEDRAGTGVGQVGKRIFSNIDDDNKNGIADSLDDVSVYAAAGEDDNDLAEVSLGTDGVAGLTGYTLWLGVEQGLRVYASDTKELLSSSASGNVPGSSGYDDEDDTWYSWTIGGTVAAPTTVYVEGLEEGEHDLQWRLVIPGGWGGVATQVIERDTVEIHVEHVIWASNENTAETASWRNESTSTWHGFMLEDAWCIDKSLEEIINGANATIRTRYPEIGGSEPKAINTGASAGEGPDIYSVSSLNQVDYTANGANGFELVLEFKFDRENNEGNVVDSGYVRINTDSDLDENGDPVTNPNKDRTQLDLFGNSGVKVADYYEIGIYDTNALLAEAETLDVVEAGDIPPEPQADLGKVSGVKLADDGQTVEGFFVNVDPVTTDKRYITRLMTGVPYNEAVAPNTALDTSNDGVLDSEELDADPFKNRPDGFPTDFYAQMLSINAGLVFGTDWNTMKITYAAERNGSGNITGYTVSTYLGSGESEALVYPQKGVAAGTDATTAHPATSLIGRDLTVRLQNHWDSGVQFRKAEITTLPSQEEED